MKISNIYTRQIRIPLRTPFKTALRTVEHVHDVLVIIETDSGQAGFGEAPPTAVITGETIGSIEAALKECDEKGIRGKRITPFLLDRIQQLTGGESLAANIQLVFNNVAVGAEVAKCLCAETEK